MYVSTKINNTIPTVVFKELSQHKPIHIKYQKHFNASTTNDTTLLLTRRKLLAKINEVTECTIDEHEQTCVKGSNFQRHIHKSCDFLCVNHKSWNQLCQVYMGLNGCIQTVLYLDWLNFTMSGHLDDFICRNFVVCLSVNSLLWEHSIQHIPSFDDSRHWIIDNIFDLIMMIKWSKTLLIDIRRKIGWWNALPYIFHKR